MKDEKTVYLLIGQRGAGKSEYARRLLEKYPHLQLLSRDEILVRLYGSTDLSPYSGAQYHAMEIMFNEIQKKLAAQGQQTIILDTFTSDSTERGIVQEVVRHHGATRVIALYFITPLKLVEKWFWQKPGIAKSSEMKSRQGERLSFFSEEAPSRDYSVFHELASGIDFNGFDEVIRIDPREELISLT